MRSRLSLTPTPPNLRVKFAIMKTNTRIAAIALSLLAIVGSQFAVVTSAEAKAAKCASVAVPGSPGTFVITCSTKRP